MLFHVGCSSISLPHSFNMCLGASHIFADFTYSVKQKHPVKETTHNRCIASQKYFIWEPLLSLFFASSLYIFARSRFLVQKAGEKAKRNPCFSEKYEPLRIGKGAGKRKQCLHLQQTQRETLHPSPPSSSRIGDTIYRGRQRELHRCEQLCALQRGGFVFLLFQPSTLFQER